MELEIVMKPVNEIIPYWRNPRRNDSVVSVLAEEIEKRGFNVPIVIDKNNVVVKGHARLRAAKKLGMTEVPCIITTAPESVVRADRIADNKIQELSSWDYGKLDMELDRLGKKMQFRKLFRPEESVDLEAEEIPVVDFTPTGLDFSAVGDDDGGEKKEFDLADVAPMGTMAGHEHVDQPEYAPVENGQPEPPQPKRLKTLCPFCGKVVVVSV